MNRILEALAANELRVKVELIDPDAVDGLQTIANRIALPLVLAAGILAAAMLVDVPTRFTLFGDPELAILLFLAAGVGGSLLWWTILAGETRSTRTR